MKPVYGYGLQKNPTYEELLGYLQSNKDTIRFPQRFFADQADPVYERVLDVANEQEMRLQERVREQQEFRANPGNVGLFLPQMPPAPAPLLGGGVDEAPEAVAGPEPPAPPVLPPPLLQEDADPLTRGILAHGGRAPSLPLALDPLAPPPPGDEREALAVPTPQFFVGDEEAANVGGGLPPPLPTPEVPGSSSLAGQAGSLVASTARLAGRGLYHTARFGSGAMDTLFDPDGMLGRAYRGATGPPDVRRGSSGTQYGWEMLRRRQQAQANRPERLAGGGLVVGDTVMRNRDRPVDEQSIRMQEAAYRDGLLPRPPLRSVQEVNGGGAAGGERRGSLVAAAAETARAAAPYVRAAMPYPYGR